MVRLNLCSDIIWAREKSGGVHIVRFPAHLRTEEKDLHLQRIKSSIYPLLLIQSRVRGARAYQSCHGGGGGGRCQSVAGLTQRGRQTFTLTFVANLDSPIILTLLNACLNCRKKPEYLEKTPTDTWRACKKPGLCCEAIVLLCCP